MGFLAEWRKCSVCYIQKINVLIYIEQKENPSKSLQIFPVKCSPDFRELMPKMNNYKDEMWVNFLIHDVEMTNRYLVVYEAEASVGNQFHFKYD